MLKASFFHDLKVHKLMDLFNDFLFSDQPLSENQKKIFN